MAWIIDRVFKERTGDIVTQAIAEHTAFAATHPVPFEPDQRRASILQRCALKGVQGAKVAALVDAALKGA